ncbi:MAG: MFS transporter [Phycisphaerae bacterium]|nr:MFS transporter [Phycisphaerae bacterium]
MDTRTDVNAGAQPGGAGRGAVGWIGRVTGIERGEGPATVLAATYFFLLLASYYLLRPIRESMGISGGAEKLPWLMTGTLAVMLVASPAFGALVSRLPRARFVPLTYRFFALNIVVFFVLFEVLPRPALGLGYAFYIWLSVFNLFVVSVFWGFLADVFAPAQARRLFGVIGVGGTLGAIAGAGLASVLAEGGRVLGLIAPKIDSAYLMLAAVIPLELSVWCARGLARRAGAWGRGHHQTPEPTTDIWSGFRLLTGSPYLGGIALYIFLFTVPSTIIYIQQGSIVERTFADKASRTAAFASLDLYTNILTLAVQLTATARLVRWLGLGAALAILPTITLAGFAALFTSPTWGVLSVLQVVRRAAHYAVDRPSREMLFAPLGPDEKYKTKSFIDTFVYRAGDTMGGWAPTWMAAAGIGLPWLAFPVAAVSFVLAFWLGGRGERAGRR